MKRLLTIVVVALLVTLVPASASAGFKLPFRMPWQKSAKVQKKKIANVGKDVQRLESLLANMKTSAKISDKSWKSAANEADMLASRIYTTVKQSKPEKDALRTAEVLRSHVRNLKKEAFKGDYRKTRRHANRALGAASRLDEWAG